MNADYCTQESLFDLITDFFNGKLPYFPLKDKVSNSENKGFLLYLDNAEELVTHDFETFRLWISTILEECSLLSIVITSRKGMNPDDLFKISTKPDV